MNWSCSGGAEHAGEVRSPKAICSPFVLFSTLAVVEPSLTISARGRVLCAYREPGRGAAGSRRHTHPQQLQPGKGGEILGQRKGEESCADQSSVAQSLWQQSRLRHRHALSNGPVPIAMLAMLSPTTRMRRRVPSWSNPPLIPPTSHIKLSSPATRPKWPISFLPLPHPPS